MMNSCFNKQDIKKKRSKILNLLMKESVRLEEARIKALNMVAVGTLLQPKPNQTMNFIVRPRKKLEPETKVTSDRLNLNC